MRNLLEPHMLEGETMLRAEGPALKVGVDGIQFRRADDSDVYQLQRDIRPEDRISAFYKDGKCMIWVDGTGMWHLGEGVSLADAAECIKGTLALQFEPKNLDAWYHGSDPLVQKDKIIAAKDAEIAELKKGK